MQTAVELFLCVREENRKPGCHGIDIEHFLNFTSRTHSFANWSATIIPYYASDQQAIVLRLKISPLASPQTYPLLMTVHVLRQRPTSSPILHKLLSGQTKYTQQMVE
jgi:hypothetical protein